MREKIIQTVCQTVQKEFDMGFCAINQENFYTFSLQNPKRETIHYRYNIY
jgi:hypothetical protein